MKKPLSILFAIALFSACSVEDQLNDDSQNTDVETPKEELYELTLIQESVSVDSEGSDEKVYFIASHEWTATVTKGDSWIDINKDSGDGSAKKQYIKITVDENTSVKSRVGKVTFEMEGADACVFEVLQEEAKEDDGDKEDDENKEDEKGEGDQGGEDSETLMTISDVCKAEDNSPVETKGLVIATYARGVLIKDATGMLLVYSGSDAGVAAGTKIKVAGIKAMYGGLPQIGGSPTLDIISEGNDVEHPVADVIDGAGMDVGLGGTQIRFVEFVGRLRVSGYYYNVEVAGASTAVGSISYPHESMNLDNWVDRNIRVQGYYIGTTGTRYYNVMAVYVTDFVSEDGTVGENEYVDNAGVSHGDGIEVDGVVWAPVNCGYEAATSTNKGYPYGRLYQWGRKYGQGYDTDYDASAPTCNEGPVSEADGQSYAWSSIFITSASREHYNPDAEYTFDWTERNDDLWNSGTESSPVRTAGDPCPEGWRVPSYDELASLAEHYSDWTQDDQGHKGYWFSGSSTYTSGMSDAVFLPAAGFRKHTGFASARGSIGGYWCSLPYDYNMAYTLGLADGSVSLAAERRAQGFSVRCVKE